MYNCYCLIKKIMFDQNMLDCLNLGMRNNVCAQNIYVPNECYSTLYLIMIPKSNSFISICM